MDAGADALHEHDAADVAEVAREVRRQQEEVVLERHGITAGECGRGSGLTLQTGAMSTRKLCLKSAMLLEWSAETSFRAYFTFVGTFPFKKSMKRIA